MTRALTAAVLAASATTAAILAFKDTPPRARPPRIHLADDIPHPSGRPHVNECPLRYGIGADVEVAWR